MRGCMPIGVESMLPSLLPAMMKALASCAPAQAASVRCLPPPSLHHARANAAAATPQQESSPPPAPGCHCTCPRRPTLPVPRQLLQFLRSSGSTSTVSVSVTSAPMRAAAMPPSPIPVWAGTRPEKKEQLDCNVTAPKVQVAPAQVQVAPAQPHVQPHVQPACARGKPMGRRQKKKGKKKHTACCYTSQPHLLPAQAPVFPPTWRVQSPPCACSAVDGVWMECACCVREVGQAQWDEG